MRLTQSRSLSHGIKKKIILSTARVRLHPRLVGYHELEGNAEIILLFRGIATPLWAPL